MIAASTRITWSILLNTVAVKLSTYFRDAIQPVRRIAAPTESPDALPLNSIKFARTFVREITELGYFRRAARPGPAVPLALEGSGKELCSSGSRGHRRIFPRQSDTSRFAFECPRRPMPLRVEEERERPRRGGWSERSERKIGADDLRPRHRIVIRPRRAFAWRGNDAPSFRGLGLTYSARKAVARKTSGLRADTGKSLITGRAGRGIGAGSRRGRKDRRSFRGAHVFAPRVPSYCWK